MIVADGYGVKIHVARGHLTVEDGIGGTRRTRRIPRVDATAQLQTTSSETRIARLVILSDTGFVTMEAMRWCADLGVTVIQLDRTGRILMCSPGQSGDARLRAAQVHADGTDTATGIMRDLLSAKVSGQSRVITDIFSNAKAADTLADLSSRISIAESMPDMLGYEGQAATVYWRAWRNHVFVPFSPSDMSLVPAHWYSFQGRASKRNPGLQGKNATDPVNACVNYAYALCESEARYACHVIGLDPALGFGHTGHTGSDTLVYDLMEALRPEADRVVLSLMDTGKGIPYQDGKPAYFYPLWFMETRDAVCRLSAPLTHMLAERIPAAVARLAGNHAESIARTLAATSRHKPRIPQYTHTASPARLRVVQAPKVAADLTPLDVLPDAAWEAVRSLIPAEPVVSRHKQERSDSRTVLAGILCHEIAGISWKAIPASFGISWNTYRRRLAEWQQAGVWDVILKTVRESVSTPRVLRCLPL